MKIKSINYNRNFMQRIDLAYLYEFSVFFNNIHSIDEYWSKDRTIKTLKLCEKELKTIMYHSIYSPYLTICLNPAMALFDELDEFYKKINAPLPKNIDLLQYLAREFETVLKSALANLPAYIVTTKGGYDINILTLEPYKAFPSLLLHTIPHAKYDVEQAARCLAFDVPTAAAFHLHRVNEIVLHRYWEVISKEPPLKKSNVGAYLKAMESIKDKGWNPSILCALKQINELHRNPTLHPEQELNAEEAIVLFGIINSVVASMLTAISEKQKATAPLALTQD